MANNATLAEFEAAIIAHMGDDPLSFLLHNVVEEYTPEELTTNETVRLVVLIARNRLTELGRPQEFADYVLAKNIKVFGGINEYVADFFRINPTYGLDPIDYALSLPYGERRFAITDSTTMVLRKMLLQPGLTAENRTRIEAAIHRLNPQLAAAPAAGGARARTPAPHRARARRGPRCRPPQPHPHRDGARRRCQ